MGHTVLRRGGSALRKYRVRQLLESLWASAGIQGFLLLSGIAAARGLGPAGRGDLAIALVLPAVATQVVTIGIPAAATYFIAKNRDAWETIAKRLTTVAVLQSGLASAAILGLDSHFLGHKTDFTRLAEVFTVAAAPLLIVQYYGLAILQGLGQIRAFNVYRVAPVALYALGLLGALFFGLSVAICASVWLGSQALTTVGIMRLLAQRARQTRTASSTSIPTQTELVKFGVIGFLAQVSPVETFRVDQLAVASFFRSQVVGYYAVAASLSNVPRFIADGIVAVGYPHVAEEDLKVGMKSARRYLAAAVALCGGSSLLIAVLIPWLIPALFGQRFGPATSVSVILLAAAAFISVRRVGSDCLRALGRPGATTAIEIATWAALAPGLVFLGHWGGGRGVALALLLSAATGLGLLVPQLWLKRRR